MAEVFSIRQFLRCMPNALLARYFHSRGQFMELDFSAMKQTQHDDLLHAWDSLPDAMREACEAELGAVHALCDEKGWKALQDAASTILQDEESVGFIAQLAALEDHHAQAMTAYLDRKSLWMWAERYVHADSLPYWKHLHGLRQVDVSEPGGACTALSAAIRAYFLKTEHRGRNCTVEHYRRLGKDYFFAYPRDHASAVIEWVRDNMTKRPHSPAFQLVFVYEKARGALHLSCRGATKAKRALQKMFARVVLGQASLPPEGKDDSAYDLSPLLDASFQFVRSAESGIADVQIKRLRLSSKFRKGEHITLEAGSTAALQSLLDQVRRAEGLAGFHVTQAGLRALVYEAGRAAPTPVPFTVGWPSSCSLKHEGAHAALRDMLRDSSIEPRS